MVARLKTNGKNKTQWGEPKFPHHCRGRRPRRPVKNNRCEPTIWRHTKPHPTNVNQYTACNRKIMRITIRREQAPALRCYLIFGAHPWRSVFSSADQTAPYPHTRGNLFPVNSSIYTPMVFYFSPTSLSKLRWQPIFIPAQGSSYTIKTVGGEAVRRFFSLEYAVLLYTISTLFRELSLRKQKSFRKVFCQAFFQKSVIASPASPRVPSRPHASPRVP